MSLKKIGAAMVVLALLALLSTAFIGWQTRWYRDTNESPAEMWEPFVKQRVSLRILYLNPLDCGACEERSLGDLDTADRQELAAICQDRYGLTSIDECISRLK